MIVNMQVRYRYVERVIYCDWVWTLFMWHHWLCDALWCNVFYVTVRKEKKLRGCVAEFGPLDLNIFIIWILFFSVMKNICSFYSLSQLLFYFFMNDIGRAMAQVVSHWPLTVEFAPGSIHVGFVVDKLALGQVFLRVLRFSPVNISFHRRSPNSYHLGNA
jgi:hypothetical protein